jgi:hypothetical protein
MQEQNNSKRKKAVEDHGMSGFLWFLGVIGAAIYFIQGASSFGEGVIGLLKAFVWPVYFVYHFFAHIGL